MNRSNLGIAGSALLFIGTFMPIVSLPIVGSMNYFQNGKGDGVIIAILAVISLVLCLKKKFSALWLTGLGALAVCAFTFVNFQMKISEMKDSMDSELAGNPFRGLADVAMQSIQLQWGWAVLLVGIGCIIAAAYMKDETAPAAAE